MRNHPVLCERLAYTAIDTLRKTRWVPEWFMDTGARMYDREGVTFVVDRLTSQKYVDASFPLYRVKDDGGQ